MHIVYMHESPLYTYTHQVAFWRPWICTSRYWTLVSVVQVFDETIRIARSLSLSLILVFSSLLYSCYFLILPLSHSAAIFFPLFICYHCVRLYMYYCSDFDLWFRFIACSGYFRLSVYIWGIFLAYIRPDSRRDSVPTYFGKQGVTKSRPISRLKC